MKHLRDLLLVASSVFWATFLQGETFEVKVESGDLKSLLQSNASRQACDDYWQTIRKPLWKTWTADSIREAVPKHVRELCGKYIFTYGTPSSTAAVPESYLQAAMQYFTEKAGENFSRSGLIANPDDPGFPIGMGRTRSSNRLTQVVAGNKMRHAAACAMCHLGQLEDGRYSYGMPNEKINFSNLAITFTYPVWLISSQKNNPKVWLPELNQQYQQLRKIALNSKDPNIILFDFSFLPSQLRFGSFLKGLLSLPDVKQADQRDFLYPHVGKGPVFYIALGTTEKISLSIPSLWDITSPQGFEDQMDRYRLGAFVHSPSLETHVAEALLIGAGESKYGRPEWTTPVADFIRTFKSPTSRASRNATLYDQGQSYFSQNCVSCHSETNGGSGKLFPVESMGLHKTYEAPYITKLKPANRTSKKHFKWIYDLYARLHPDLDWEGERGVRVRRVKGAWAKSYLTSGGAVEGLDDLLCLNGKTRDSAKVESQESDLGHHDLCLNHSEQDRRALKEFLLHWD